MFFSKVITLTFAVFLASSAQAATLNRRQATAGADQCIGGLKQATTTLSEVGDMVISKALPDLFIASQSALKKEAEIASKLTELVPACCSGQGSNVFSDADAKSYGTEFDQFSAKLLALVSDFNTRRATYIATGTLFQTSISVFKIYGDAVDALSLCTSERAPAQANQLKAQASKISEAINTAAEARLTNVFGTEL